MYNITASYIKIIMQMTTRLILHFNKTIQLRCVYTPGLRVHDIATCRTLFLTHLHNYGLLVVYAISETTAVADLDKISNTYE